MVTLRDVGKKVGLNVSTVSRALRDAPDISPATCEMVKRAAVQMGYRMRPQAKKSKAVGLIVPEVVSHYYAEMVETTHRELRKRGYSLITCVGGFDVGEILAACDELMTHDVCGLIINDCFHLDGDDDLQRHNRISHSVLPLILISDNVAHLPVDTIRIDNGMAVRLVLEHLMDLGHKKIAYLGEYASDVRYDAYLSTMREYGLEINEAFIRRGRERFELGGYLRAKELMQDPRFSEITAVVASYDQVAYGAMNAFSEANVRVPEDISIVGFDDIIMNDFMPIQLTSISSPIEQLCALSVKLLLDSISSGEEHVVQSISLQPRIVIRNSTAAPKAQP